MNVLKCVLLAILIAASQPAAAVDYYTASGDPATGSSLSSAVLRAEYAAIAAGFVKIAPYTGNGGKIVAINAGATAQEAITTTGTGSGVRATSPTLVTPVLGVATATSINKITLTQPATSATLTLTDGKTLAATNTLTLSGTDGTTMTFPTTSATLARTDAANTFTGVQSMTSPDITTSLTSPSTTFNLLATPTTLNAFAGASTALNIGHASAAAAFLGGISIPTGKSVVGAGTAALTGFATMGDATTWTPSLKAGGGAVTMTAQYGYVVKVGNRVFVEFAVTYSSLNGQTGAVTIDGLSATYNKASSGSGAGLVSASAGTISGTHNGLFYNIDNGDAIFHLSDIAGDITHASLGGSGRISGFASWLI